MLSTLLVFYSVFGLLYLHGCKLFLLYINYLALLPKNIYTYVLTRIVFVFTFAALIIHTLINY